MTVGDRVAVSVSSAVSVSDSVRLSLDTLAVIVWVEVFPPVTDAEWCLVSVRYRDGVKSVTVTEIVGEEDFV